MDADSQTQVVRFRRKNLYQLSHLANIPILLLNKYFNCIKVFPLLCLCTPCIHCLRRPEKGTGSHETRVEKGFEQSWLPEVKHEFSGRIVLFWAIATDFLPFLVCLLLLQFCSLGILMIICYGNVFVLSCLFVVLNCSCLWMSINYLIFGGDFSIISLNNFFMSLHFIFSHLSYSIDNFF